ncbi:MAG: hypothetical protein NDI82_13425 [Anaeromyxobacteraceae bacterium]|nr:hypothetical protein [Anaeromyxobacteraceae bacterium]
MWPPTLAEAGARLQALRAHPRVRRARAAIRLHGRLLLALVLGAGIASMVVHWA